MYVKTLLPDTGETFDYVIVGAGSAGSVLADRLSENPDVTVVSLEAGGPDTEAVIRIPPDYFAARDDPAINWGFETVPQEHLDHRRIGWPRGKVWGGCSSINAMIYIRGNRIDYDQWAALGNEGWSYEDVLPIFKKSENNERGESKYNGVGGPLSVTNNPRPSEAGLAFVEACRQFGFEDSRPDFNFNGAKQANAGGLYQLTITRFGLRANTAREFLRPSLDRPNLIARTGAQVSEILFEGNRAVGVELIHHGKTVRLRARRQVILSAGSVQSPQILMLSGIGPAEELTAHGIDVKIDMPGVGQNLQDHLQYSLGYQSKIVLPPRWASGVTSGLFVRTEGVAKTEAPDLQYHFWHNVNRRGPTYGFTPTLVQPKSVGSIRLRSNDPTDFPIIQPNYLEREEDMRVLVEGFHLSRELARQPAFEPLLGEEAGARASVVSDEDIRRYIRAKTSTIYHPAGTCKMGCDPLAVVDDRLRVHGVEGLRVIDCSIMPTIVNGNTNAPTIMIAEKGASMILEDEG